MRYEYFSHAIRLTFIDSNLSPPPPLPITPSLSFLLTRPKWTPEALHIAHLAPASSRHEVIRIVEQYSSTRRSFTVLDVFSALQTARLAPNFPPWSLLIPSASHRSVSPSHVGPAYGMSFSPLIPHVFLSCGTDGVVKLCSTMRPSPAVEFQPLSSSSSSINTIISSSSTIADGDARLSAGPDEGNDYLSSSYSNKLQSATLVDVAWSPLRASLFAALASNGMLFLYDLSVSIDEPVLTRNVAALVQDHVKGAAKRTTYSTSSSSATTSAPTLSPAASVTGMSWSAADASVLSVSTSQHGVAIVQLGPSFTQTLPDTQQAVTQLVEWELT